MGFEIYSPINLFFLICIKRPSRKGGGGEERAEKETSINFFLQSFPLDAAVYCHLFPSGGIKVQQPIPHNHIENPCGQFIEPIRAQYLLPKTRHNKIFVAGLGFWCSLSRIAVLSFVFYIYILSVVAGVHRSSYASRKNTSSSSSCGKLPSFIAGCGKVATDSAVDSAPHVSQGL